MICNKKVSNVSNTKSAHFHSKKYKLVFGALFGLMLAALISASVVVGGCSAAQNQTEIPKHATAADYPNTVAQNAQIADKYKDISQEIATDTENYFMEITKVPHPSKTQDKIIEYLQSQFVSLNLQTNLDAPSNSVYVDVPASANFKDKKKVILQAHMDMVSTFVDDKPTFDPTTQGVDAVCDQDTGVIHSKDYQTNIGADDGVGMAVMLAFAKNANNFEHPAMRLLFTSDEEVGLVGASKLSEGVLDSDYLINIDGSYIGQICVSSAGTVNGDLDKTFQTSAPAANDKYVSIELTNLQGGHTADSVTKPIVRATHLGFRCLNELSKNNIPYKLASFVSGTSANSFPTSWKTQFYVDESKLAEAKTICENFINEELKTSTDEKEPKLLVTTQLENAGQNSGTQSGNGQTSGTQSGNGQTSGAQSGNDQTSGAQSGNSDASSSSAAQKVLNAEDSKKLIENLLLIPDGVIKMSEIDPEIPESSCSIAKFSLKDGSLAAKLKLRSSNNETIDDCRNKFPLFAEYAGVTYTETASYYAFPNSSETQLTQAMTDGFKNACGISAAKHITHGGLELSWFAVKKPSMQQISIGFDIDNEHKTTESYYKNTTPKLVSALIDATQNLS